ncbi:ABC transporter permease [Aestuariimicrobium sp. T2.26MG-19.2B]|uniref:ABC transporter permease n=1 Tax=Aestuariimicrobium sp. T2.26MG-19.2B TaxID=3040679 RepID=UPI002477A5C6|nr:ABC transporter permease [Aestuariimicrobium sp. T2.26MG-19.2B]CAI9406737.1 Dipeptide transport system permease protein DppB [Aestuariimicrobium sp. T2.26MG-19.2B]
MAQMVVEPTTPLGSGPRAIATEAPLSPRHTGRLRLPGGLGAGRARFFLRRVGAYLVVAWAAVTLNFIIPRFMPGDPAEAVLRRIQFNTGRAPLHSEIEAVRRIYGDPQKNIIGQYFDYWSGVIHFDFGVSTTSYPTPVSELILQALPWTVFLVGSTTLIAWLIGTALGALMGWKPGNTFDSIFAPVTTFFHAFPGFWLGLVLLWIFAIKLQWLPVSGGYDPNVPFSLGNFWFVLSVIFYGALPMFALIFIGFNGWLFSMRNVMVATVTEDYVLLARAKGLKESTILMRYAARNALLPNVTGLAMAIGGVIGGTVLIEAVFTYPGMGFLLQNAISQHDFPTMQTVLLMLTACAIVANFVADSIYVLLDPRVADTN